MPNYSLAHTLLPQVYMGWIDGETDLCTVYAPANGRNARVRTSAAYEKLCVPNSFAYLCEEW